MAFSGLPSKACANCRQRRIKCNLGEPACAQCSRAGKVCPGYRDQLALLFRDENAKVIRKAGGEVPTPPVNRAEGSNVVELLQAKRDPPQPPPQPTTSYELERRSMSYSPTADIILNQLVTSLEDPGVAFFFRRFVTVPSPIPASQPDIVSSQLWRGISDCKPFLDAISCVGLAGLSNVNKDQEMMRVARLKYAVTLKRVMTALQDPKRADIVYTLKAVVMLSLFEMTNSDTPGASMFGVHLDGIAALLNSNKFLQFHSKFQVRVKHQFYFAMFIKHVQSGQKLPQTMAKWAQVWASGFRETDAAPVEPLTDIIIRFIDLHASAQQGQVASSAALIQDALVLEEELEAWRNALPPGWKYKVVYSSPASGTYNGQYHIYSDHWIAHMWDHYRWTRILVHELILTHLLQPLPLPPPPIPSPPPFVPPPPSSSHSSSRLEMPSPPPPPPPLPQEQQQQKARSLHLISQLSTRICASVVTQLDHTGPATSASTPTPATRSQLMAVFMLLWPLKVAGAAIGVPQDLHDWVIDALEGIARTMGIRQARVIVLAAVLQREYWKSVGLYI